MQLVLIVLIIAAFVGAVFIGADKRYPSSEVVISHGGWAGGTTTIWTDPGTGCEYINPPKGILTPRLGPNGMPICKKEENGGVVTNKDN